MMKEKKVTKREWLQGEMVTMEEVLNGEVVSEAVRKELEKYWERCGSWDVAMILGCAPMPVLELERIDYYLDTLALKELKWFVYNRHEALYGELVNKLEVEKQAEDTQGEAKTDWQKRYETWHQLLSWEEDVQEIVDKVEKSLQ